MEKYCAYLRKSRADLDAEQRGEGETLARHEKALLDLSRRQNLNITAIYREVVSGDTIAARPVMQQLLSEVEQGEWSGCLVMEVERLARGDTIDQGIVAQTFKFSGTKIITPVKTYDPDNEYDEEYFEFGLFMSRREYKTINRRLQRGRLASVKEGKYVGSKPPYGYVRQKLEDSKGFTLTPDPEQSDVVRMIFELYVTGEIVDGKLSRLGTGLIANRLNELNIPSTSGSKWVPGSIRDILINPTYIGKLRWNWRPAKKHRISGEVKSERPRNYDCEVVDGLQPALVPVDTFERAQIIMNSNPSPLHKSTEMTNPLAGLVVCGKCGRKMQRRPYKSGQPASFICPYTTCDNVSSDFNSVETRILSALADWLASYKLTWNIKVPGRAEAELMNKSLKKTDNDLKELYAQRNNIHDLLERGVYDTDTFLSRSQVLNVRIHETEQTKVTLETSLEKDELRRQSELNIVPKIEHLLSVYSSLSTPKSKNDLMREVLEKVVYIKNVKGYGHNKPDDFDITLFPRFPHL